MQLDSWNIALKPQDQNHRRERRIADQNLRPTTMGSYIPMQNRRVQQLFRSLSHELNKFEDHIQL